MNVWIRIRISTGFFIKFNLSLRKRSVLRKDIDINFSTAPFLCTYFNCNKISLFGFFPTLLIKYK